MVQLLLLPRCRARTYINHQLEEAAKTLAKQNESLNEELADVNSGSATGERSESKKVFVEPTISVPVDVLETTTFFQISESGPVN